MSSNLAKMMLEDFLKNSWSSVQAILAELDGSEGDKTQKFKFLKMIKNHVGEVELSGEHFFLRSSMEYSNPQLPVEEVQGIVAARLLEVCGNYCYERGMREIGPEEIPVILELLRKPKQGRIISFLLNTDDVEPDRYSINPLKGSIVESGQSAFPAAYVEPDLLAIDDEFVKKYEGSLISKFETDLISQHLAECKDGYMNMVDAVKCDHLKMLSDSFGIDLCLPMMRMPLSILQNENAGSLLHRIISESHKDFESIERVYNCMGRSMKNRTTLLTVPHSKKGFGSKRAARGKIYFEGTRLKNVRVTYQTTPLYHNAIDPEDISIARAEDDFTVDRERLVNYSFAETPSSPQFILYSLGSPEDAALWHGVGAFGASQLVKSYTSIRLACAKDSMIGDLLKYGVRLKSSYQFNIIPDSIWFHPIHRNIDTSIGCVDNLEFLAKTGINLEHLSPFEYARQNNS